MTIISSNTIFFFNKLFAPIILLTVASPPIEFTKAYSKCDTNNSEQNAIKKTLHKPNAIKKILDDTSQEEF